MEVRITRRLPRAAVGLAAVALTHRIRPHAKVDEAEAKISHLEALLAEHEDTIATQQQTFEHLTGDNMLLRRNLFGSRRERYTDPSQTYLFDTTVVEAEASPSHTDNTPVEPRKKRTSKGRGRRVFPEFLPREEQKHCLKEEDIPEELRNDPDARRFFKKVGEKVQ